MSQAVQQEDLELFHQAIRTGNVQDFNKYFKDEFLEKEQFGRRPVHYASRQGQKEILKLLLDKQCDINARSSDNWLAIHYACRESHVEVVQLLIDYKCKIEECDGDLSRPIHHASRFGPLDIAELLIGKGCNIEAKNKNDWRPIHYACRNNQLEIAKKIIESKCDIEACTKLEMWRPVHFVCRYGHIEILRILMSESVDLEAHTSNNWRPIHFACKYEYANIVQTLLERGVNIESRTSDKMRPIHFVCLNGNCLIAQLLIDKGCDIESCNEENWRPIHFASRHGHFAIVEMLINAGCDLEVSTLDQMRPIHFACKYPFKAGVEIAALLIERNCQIKVQNESNHSPLDLALDSGNEEVINLIKEKLENPNMTNGHRLLSACEERNLEKAKLMIQRKCDINFCDNDDMRPIHWACMKGHIEIVKLLLENNCELEIVDKFNRSPISIASELEKEKLNQIFNEEISLRKLIEEMASSMDVKCSSRCTHKFCSFSLHSKTFEKETFIGKGKFGKVYRCQSSQTNREFAVKFINLNFISKKLKNCENILLTVNNHLRYLDHERIVKFYGAFVKSDSLCIFMEFIPGSIRQDILSPYGYCTQMYYSHSTSHQGTAHNQQLARGTLQKKIGDKDFHHEKCIHYTRQILEGVAYLHEGKLIHRDIKPGNILLDCEDNVKLVDFDLSRLLMNSDGQSSSAKTIFGTAIYMAPEIFNGESYTCSADIWSVGITIVSMISGKTPYNDLQPQVAMCKIANTKKIEFSQKFNSKKLECFIENELLNPDPLKRCSAAKLLESELFDLILENILVH